MGGSGEGEREAAYSTLCSELLTLSALPTAFAPSSPISLGRRLRGRAGSRCQRLLTVKASTWGGGVLERRGCRIRGEQAPDDHGGSRAKSLGREVDLLDGFLAAQLLDLKRMAIDTAGSTQRLSAAADTFRRRALGAQGDSGGWRVAHPRVASVELTLRPSASVFAPLAPMLLPRRLRWRVAGGVSGC